MARFVLLKHLLEQASPLPWPMDISRSEGGEGGTTCSESNANTRLSRHASNLLPGLVELLELVADTVQASCAETDVSDSVKSYRKELFTKCEAMLIKATRVEVPDA